MKLRTKLLALVILPVLLCTTVAVTISLLKIKKQGVEGLEDKSSAILSISVEEYLLNHESGFSIQQIEEEESLKEDESFGQAYEFRIASLDPENPKHLSTSEDNDFIEQFKKEKSKQITYIDKKSNELLVMRPVFMHETDGCLDCHISKTADGNIEDESALRGIFIVKSSMDNTNAQVSSAIFRISLFGILIMLVAIFVGFLVISKIISSVKQINMVSKKVAEGDLQQEVVIRTGDELEELGSYINIMIHSINKVLLGVHDATNELSLFTSEIANTSNTLSEGANKSAASIEEISSTMEEITSNIQKNTENAQQTEVIAEKASEEILNGSQKVNETVASMKDIAGKISVINDIANQTNILALNAAVEAARAGEHGKGFAVVSAEVRKLAERSQVAANQIETLTNSSVADADISGQILSELVSEIQDTAKYVREITASSIEQNSSSAQVNSVMQELNQVSQQNALASGELASRAGELAKQTELLKDLISFFIVDTQSAKQEMRRLK